MVSKTYISLRTPSPELTQNVQRISILLKLQTFLQHELLLKSHEPPAIIQRDEVFLHLGVGEDVVRRLRSGRKGKLGIRWLGLGIGGGGGRLGGGGVDPWRGVEGTAGGGWTGCGGGVFVQFWGGGGVLPGASD